MHVPPKHSASWSADKLQVAPGKHGRRRLNAGKNASRTRRFPPKNADVFQKSRWTPDSAGAVEQNRTTKLDKEALVFVRNEDNSGESSRSSNSSGNGDDKEDEPGWNKKPLHKNLPVKVGSSLMSSSSSPAVEVLDRDTSFTTVRRATAVSSASFLQSSRTTASKPVTTKSTKDRAKTTTNVKKSLTEDSEAFGLFTDGKAEAVNVAVNRIPDSSPWLLFCFYDDRSSIRSPGFTAYNFPSKLCTDIAYCCVDVNAKGHVLMSKQLKLFFKVVSEQLFPANHLFVTIGGHRVLGHHLDAALTNTANFAMELSHQVQELGAGGLAIYLEDVEILKHAFRVHDLIMAVRGVSVAVVLPRDLRQQVRYYRTEIYANTKGMLVISPPSQGYGRDSRPEFATCPHPRRSVHEGSSLEFIYQLSRTLLSSMADGADYASGVASAQGDQPVPCYLIGISFGGLMFELKNRSQHDVGAPATFVRHVPYREICKQPWRHWYDNVSECFVAWDGDRSWMSSLGPRSMGFTRELAKGLALFDLDFDDHRGECGHKFPVLRALRTALLA
ncbi:hypothetical protein V5799_033208 [Amblyomma americanum]|uniref:Uncharacterized protein n=1 Tax=Amblyomma americanum TaxID=6943 RepID=A0AAQ4DNZ3_AMBAM